MSHLMSVGFVAGRLNYIAPSLGALGSQSAQSAALLPQAKTGLRTESFSPKGTAIT